jgi:uncharacterized protein (TIGR02246 family)
MNTHPVCHARAAAAVLVALSLGLGAAQAQDAAPEARDADRAAVAAAMQSLAQAFEARDAKRLAQLWTAEGAYENDRGVSVQGREALEQGFAKVFAKTPELTVALRSESVRFLSANTAIDEGRASIRRGLAEPLTEAEYEALLVREGDQWLIAQLRDAEIVDASIDELAWLVGTWKTPAGEDAEIVTSYAWNDGKTFLRVHFSCTDKSQAVSGDQMIGVDPATGQIHAWIFGDDGGVGESQWQRDGDHWTIAAAGTLDDGSTLVETNVLRRIDDDTFTWQSIGRALDDAPLPDQPPVRVTRVKQQ